MSTAAKKLRDLDKDPLIEEAFSLAEHVYSKLADMPDDEKWYSEAKLRSLTVDLLATLAQALGNASPSTTEFDWAQARKYAFALKTLYRFTCRQKFIELEPQTMVRFTGLIKQIDAEVIKAYDQTAKKDKKDIELWEKKYWLWKETNHED